MSIGIAGVGLGPCQGGREGRCMVYRLCAMLELLYVCVENGCV